MNFNFSHHMLLPMSLVRQLLVLAASRNSRKDFYGTGIHMLKMASFSALLLLLLLIPTKQVKRDDPAFPSHLYGLLL